MPSFSATLAIGNSRVARPIAMSESMPPRSRLVHPREMAQIWAFCLANNCYHATTSVAFQTNGSRHWRRRQNSPTDMMMQRARGEAAVLGFALVPNFSMIAFASAIEPLRLANRVSGEEIFRWRLYSPDGHPVSASNGVVVTVDGSYAEM